VEPTAQIEAFLVQMSIRIYWMERMLGGETAAGEEVAVTMSAVKPAERKSGAMDKLRPLLVGAERFLMPVAMLAGVLIAALTANSFLRRRARYRFPDFEVEPRLGGSHAAGVGAVISFASAALPPASQRDQVPDYLRRA
jgi:hypothetical protein